MRARKVDANQSEIVSMLRQVPGVSVHCTHMVADGFPDLVVGYKGGNYLFEVKDGKKAKSARKLTEDESRFHATWKGRVYVIESFDDALKILL